MFGLDLKPQFDRLQFAGCHPLTLLLLVQYLHTDDVAIWDFRVSNSTKAAWQPFGVNSLGVKQDLLALSQLLKLPRFLKAVESVLKMANQRQLEADMCALCLRACQPTPTSLKFHERGGSDLVLQSPGGISVQCHSAILRVPSTFFSTLFDDPVWTLARRTNGDVITIDLRHLEWRSMEFRSYCDEGQDMFSDIAWVKSSNQLVELVFSKIAAANELLIDKLILIRSKVILQHTSLQNACDDERRKLSPAATPANQIAPSTQSHCRSLDLATTSSTPISMDHSTAVCATVGDATTVAGGEPLSGWPRCRNRSKVTPPVDSSAPPVWKGKGASRSIERQSGFESDNEKPEGYGGLVPNSEQAYRRTPSSRHARIAGFSEMDALALPSGTSQVVTEPEADTSPSASSPWKAVPKTAVSIAASNLKAQRPLLELRGLRQLALLLRHRPGWLESYRRTRLLCQVQKARRQRRSRELQAWAPSSYGGISVTTKKSGDA
ncbi:hypothetical protein FRC04_006606 [Tulasnella sp. 424]|nr:hypothetical protein FRC04_006606 [Tulasnella sp. 424]KAG8960828.1 hypothetical protein FRC05_006549 [Tulasnella sp. 425]